MIISLVNHTGGTLDDAEIQRAVRAINRQITEDFQPSWGMGATLHLEGASGKQPDKLKLAEMRGDAVIYVWDKADLDDAIGYHDTNLKGIPYGFVFLEVARELEESWTATLSHEALELLADPYVNLLAMGPHPADRRVTVFHWFEMCDAVQAETYQLDGVDVSNFVLPLYFTKESEAEGRNDFLGTSVNGQTLSSFGVNPGGYVGFYDPRTRMHETFTLAHDATAQRRRAIKGRLKNTRRAIRYQRFHPGKPRARKK